MIDPLRSRARVVSATLRSLRLPISLRLADSNRQFRRDWRLKRVIARTRDSINKIGFNHRGIVAPRDDRLLVRP